MSPSSSQSGSTGDALALITLLLEAEALHQCGSWSLNHSTGTVLWSPQTRALLGLDAGSTPSVEALLAVVGPEERDLLSSTLRQSWLAGSTFQLEHTVLLADGTQRLLLHQGKTVCDRDGKPLRTVATLQIKDGQDELKKKLEEAIHQDPLTGLANKNGALRDLRQQLSQASYNKQIALICFDLDDFQSINERFGFEAGNAVLRWLGEWLSKQAKPSDRLARLDGDAFLLVRHEGLTSLADALALATSLQTALWGASPAQDLPLPIQLSACAGVSVAPDHASQANHLLQCANTALIEAKTKGKGSLRVYSTAISRAIRERIDLEQRLSLAMERQELRLLFQPQWDRLGRLIGAEALLRWHSQPGEWIPPHQFIPLAEQSGLIHAFGQWVLEHSLAQLARWKQAGLPLQRVAINVSARQLDPEAPRLDEMVHQACARHGISPHQLELELTETALLSQPDPACRMLQTLANAGVRLAIDDFGTGFSSLVILQQLPLHTLKIDRCFVEGVGERAADQSIVKATILMAHELGLSCLAEGVENESQYQRLLDLGCDSFQGFLLGRPLSADGMTSLLQGLSPAALPA